jgi:hypothetical protein
VARPPAVPGTCLIDSLARHTSPGGTLSIGFSGVPQPFMGMAAESRQEIAGFIWTKPKPKAKFMRPLTIALAVGAVAAATGGSALAQNKTSKDSQPAYSTSTPNDTKSVKGGAATQSKFGAEQKLALRFRATPSPRPPPPAPRRSARMPSGHACPQLVDPDRREDLGRFQSGREKEVDLFAGLVAEAPPFGALGCV